MQAGSWCLTCLQCTAEHVVSSPWVSLLMMFFYPWGGVGEDMVAVTSG